MSAESSTKKSENENFDQQQLIKAAKYYWSTLLLIWLALGIYFASPYYKSFLTLDTKIALRDLAVIYTLGAPAMYYYALKKARLSPSRAYIALTTLRRLLKEYGKYLKNLNSRAFYPAPAISREERTNLLFMVVKFFFLPLMLNFLVANIGSVRHSIDIIHSQGLQLSLANFNALLYPFLFSALIFIDTAYFTFGYAVESSALNNKVVSVDPTFLGWATALICYPPFNAYGVQILNWHADDYRAFGHTGYTTILYFVILVLMFIYTAASVALGAKASNLTNRGIVSRWPYSFVRHPAYISKNLAWWLTLLPIFSLTVALSMTAWTFIYFLRAITEERHLMMVDNGYKEYAKNVQWRFIPKVI